MGKWQVSKSREWCDPSFSPVEHYCTHTKLIRVYGGSTDERVFPPFHLGKHFLGEMLQPRKRKNSFQLGFCVGPAWFVRRIFFSPLIFLCKSVCLFFKEKGGKKKEKEIYTYNILSFYIILSCFFLNLASSCPVWLWVSESLFLRETTMKKRKVHRFLVWTVKNVYCDCCRRRRRKSVKKSFLEEEKVFQFAWVWKIVVCLPDETEKWAFWWRQKWE